MADGKITFSTKLDNAEMHKQLKDVEKEIEKAVTARGKATEAKIPLEKQLEELAPKIKQAKAELEEANRVAAETKEYLAREDLSDDDKKRVKADLEIALQEAKKQRKEVEKLEDKWSAINKKVKEYNAEIEYQNQRIAEGEEKEARIMQQLNKANGSFAGAMAKAGKNMKDMEKVMARLAKRVFVLQMITKVLRAAREYFGKLLSTNTEFNTQMAKLRGALATAFQPLYEAAVPVLMTILRLLTQIATAAAQVMAALFGTTLSQSAKNAHALNEQAKALQGVGGAAANAKKQLLGFDEINQLQNDSGGGGGNTVQMDFADLENSGAIDEGLERILNLVGKIGVAFALWKISDKLPFLGKIAMKLGGIWIAVEGIMEFVDGFKDANENGLTLYNTLEMIAGLIGGGLGISMLIGSWIPLAIAGFGALALGVAYNWSTIKTETGKALMGLMLLASLFVAAIGVVVMLTGNIPLGIGMILAGGALLAASAVIDWDALPNKMEGKLGDIVKLIGKALFAIGVALMLFGQIPLGIGAMVAGAVAMGIVEAARADESGEGFLTKIGDAMTELLKIVGGGLGAIGVVLLIIGNIPLGLGALIAGASMLGIATGVKTQGGIIEKVKAGIAELVEVVSGALMTVGVVLLLMGNIPIGLGLIAMGATGINVAEESKENGGLLASLKSRWEEIKRWYNTEVKPYFTVGQWETAWGAVGEGLKNVIKGAINRCIEWFNNFIMNVNEFMSFSIPEIDLGWFGKTSALDVQLVNIPTIPLLAQGAVIPPNAPFLAMLGDQRNGNNIEAPEDLIRKIVREETGGNGRVEELLQQLIGVVSGIQIGDETIGRAARRDDWIYARTGR